MEHKSKKKYTEPTIESVQIDQEVSLALESTPPFGPDELTMFENFNVLESNQFNPFENA